MELIPSDNQTPKILKVKPVTRSTPEPTHTQSTGVDPLVVVIGSAICGLGGYALGKKHGYNDGYNQAKAEDYQLIGQLQAQLKHLTDLLSQRTSESTQKDIEIARLNGIVENQASTLKWQQLQLTAEIFPSNNDGDNGNGQLN